MPEPKFVEFPRIEVAEAPYHEFPVLVKPEVMACVDGEETTIATVQKRYTIETILEDVGALRDYIYNSHGADQPIQFQLMVNSTNGDIIMQWM